MRCLPQPCLKPAEHCAQKSADQICEPIVQTRTSQRHERLMYLVHRTPNGGDGESASSAARGAGRQKSQNQKLEQVNQLVPRRGNADLRTGAAREPPDASRVQQGQQPPTRFQARSSSACSTSSIRVPAPHFGCRKTTRVPARPARGSGFKKFADMPCNRETSDSRFSTRNAT